MTKVLVVEDDLNQSQALADWFTDNGYSVDQAYTCLDARTFVAVSSYDMMVCDWNLPDGEGVELIREIRGKGIAIPILMLTARAAIDEKAFGFDSGADDYLTKPFHPLELQARVKALLRRPAVFVQDLVTLGDLTLNKLDRQVKVGTTVVSLSPKEFELLHFLARHPDQVVSAETILRRVWDTDTDTTADNIRKYIQRIRAKLAKSGSAINIDTLHGVGYSLRTA